MNLAAESSSSFETLSRSMEDLVERTLKLNEKMMEKYQEALKLIEKHKLGSIGALSRSMEDLVEKTLKLNERIMKKYENILKVIEEHSLSIGNNFQIRDEIQKAVSAISNQIMERTFRIAGFQNAMNFKEEALPAYNYVPYLEKIISQMKRLIDIQVHMLSVLRQLGASWGPLVDTVNAISDSISQLSTDKKVPGGEFGEFVTAILENAVATMLVDSLASDGTKIGNIYPGKALLTILLSIATVKLADSDDVISRLIGAPITAFLATYAYKGDIVFSLKVASVVFAWDIGFDIGKEIGKQLFPENTEYYDNFHWFGENGFFDYLFTGDIESDLYDIWYGAKLMDLDFSNMIIEWFSGVDEWFAKNANLSFISAWWEDIVKWWDNTVVKWWDENVVIWFKEDTWNKLLEVIPKAFSKYFEDAVEEAKKKLEPFISLVEYFFGKMDIIISSTEKFSSNVPLKTPVRAYASGGFPEDGLFYANHNELIGQFSNGKTVVANNDMITTGIEEAAYRGFIKAMNESGGNHSNVVFRVEGDPRGLFKIVQEESQKESNRLQRMALG